MKLRWVAPTGEILYILTPSAETPNVAYLYLTHDGFGGSESEISLGRGAYQDGQTLQSKYLTSRRLSVTFAILTGSAEVVQARRRTVVKAFSSKMTGTLIWTQADGSEYAIKCISDSGSPSFPQGYNCGEIWQVVILDLVAPDPCWYSYPIDEIHLAGLTGGATFPIEFPASFATMGSTRAIENLGGVPAPVQITISGPIENPVLENLTTGKSLSLTLEVLEEESVEIDTTYGALSCYHVATNGTRTNAMAYLSSDSEFWQLEPGENIITYSATSGSAEVVVNYTSRYSGV